jgi:ATP-dependent DNA ligase
MTLPKLFKKREAGGLQEWSIEVEAGKYRTISGMVGGAMVTSEWTEAVVKNAGRANATSVEDQAAAEAQSKWTKKHDGGYREDPDQLDSVDLFKPMLAEKVKDYPVTKFPVYVQPKLDGARCAGRLSGLWSRKGKPWVATPHIEKEVNKLLVQFPSLVLDGELYNHEFHDDFNRIISIIKKQKPTAEDFAESEKYAQYHVYDCQFLDLPDLTFKQRQDKLRGILEAQGTEYIILVDTKLVADEAEMDAFHQACMEDGYEGSMVRTDTRYENKRTKALLKRKEFIDAEFELEDVEEGKGNAAGMAYKVVVKGEPITGSSRAGMRGNAAFRKDLFINKAKYIGKQVTVRYQNMTPEGKLRIGIMLCVRDYE